MRFYFLQGFSVMEYGKLTEYRAGHFYHLDNAEESGKLILEGIAITEAEYFRRAEIENLPVPPELAHPEPAAVASQAEPGE